MSMPNLNTLRASPKAWRDWLYVHPRDAWQEADFEATDPAWLRMAGVRAEGGFARSWSVRHRGASKTQDGAAMPLWACVTIPRRTRGVVASGKQDQARLVVDAIQRFVDDRPELGRFVEIQNHRVLNKHTGSTLDVLSHQSETSMGLLLDYATADEVTTWPKRDLFDVIYSATAKKPNVVFQVFSNAGVLGSWQHALWCQVQQDPAWHASAMPADTYASWMKLEAIEEQRRLLGVFEFDRWFRNRWTVAEAAAIPPEQLARAKRLAGPQRKREDLKTLYVCGGDLAIRRDAAALCVLGFRADGSIHLARTHLFQPLDYPGREIPMADVEAAIWQAHCDFHLQSVVIDPAAGGLMMAQRLMERGLRCDDYPFTPRNLNDMAEVLLKAFADDTVNLHDDQHLLPQLGRLQLKQGPMGWKIVAPRGEGLHQDLAIAFLLALRFAVVFANQLKQEGGDARIYLPTYITSLHKQYIPQVYDEENPEPGSLEWLRQNGASGTINQLGGHGPRPFGPGFNGGF